MLQGRVQTSLFVLVLELALVAQLLGEHFTLLWKSNNWRWLQNPNEFFTTTTCIYLHGSNFKQILRNLKNGKGDYNNWTNLCLLGLQLGLEGLWHRWWGWTGQAEGNLHSVIDEPLKSSQRTDHDDTWEQALP